MIDRAAVLRLTLTAVIMFVPMAGAALMVWRSWALAGGLALGFGLGLAPFLSWAWIVRGGFEGVRRRILTMLILTGKLGVYAGALYFLVAREVVRPFGVMIGITLVVGVFTIGALLRPQPTKGAQP